MSKQKPLKTIAGAPERPLVINEIEIPCYVLEDETRVLSQRGLQSSIGLGTGGGVSGAPRMVELMESLDAKGIKNSDLIARLKSPLEFQPPIGRTAYGYSATILVDICNAILEANQQGVVTRRQKAIVERAMILIRGLATVGVIALVDEATGYQRIREERALATILEQFITKELQPWTKTFPYEFYEQIFRLKGWAGPNGAKRPKVIGHYTNDFVYSRIAPSLLEVLKSKNPTLPSGERRDKHHQWFTPDIGHPKLKEHLAAVIALMKASPNWEAFTRSINRALPQYDKTMQLPFYADD